MGFWINNEDLSDKDKYLRWGLYFTAMGFAHAMGFKPDEDKRYFPLCGGHIVHLTKEEVQEIYNHLKSGLEKLKSG